MLCEGFGVVLDKGVGRLFCFWFFRYRLFFVSVLGVELGLLFSLFCYCVKIRIRFLVFLICGF